MSLKKSVFLLYMADIPSAKNRALYQRALKLAERFQLTIVTAAHTEIAPEIAALSTVWRLPDVRPFASGLLFQLYYTLVIFLKLLPINELMIYSFHRKGFLAAGILKIIKRKNMLWLVDMQHTPYYYWDSTALRHFRISKRLFYGAIGLFYIAAARLFLPKADQVFVMSFGYDEGFAAIMEENFKVHRTRLLPVPNGVDIALVESFIDRKDHLPFALPSDGLRLLYAGNVRIERLSLFVDFLNALQERNMPAVLVTCGQINAAAKKFIQRQTHQKIVYLGYLPHHQLLQLYNLVDVCLIIIDDTMRDHLYSHPGKLFEAMGMGKLVLVSDLASIHKIVEDNVNGIIVQNDRLTEAVDKLIQIMNSKEEYQRLSNNARHAVKKIDWHEINTQWLSQIIKVIN